MIVEHQERGGEAGEIEQGRARQNLAWMKSLLYEMWREKLGTRASMRERSGQLEAQVLAGKLTPHAAAKKLFDGI